MTGTVKPNKKFRVYIDKLYYLVHVWPTLKDMRNHRAKLGLPRSKCQACTLLYEHRRGKQIGEMHFAQCWFNGKRSSSYVISHESAHAAFGFMRMAKVDFGKLNEEFDKFRTSSSRANMLEEVVAEVTSSVTHSITQRLKL
jgi:hypothetical protein